MQSLGSIEVLNISHLNAAGNYVLNDAKLIELVQLYPFLYNPRVRPFQDPDYEEWAWNRITVAFNRSYDDGKLYFSPANLKARWQTLLPIIHRLRDQDSIPEPLRQILVKINVQLQDQTTDVRVNNFSVPQKLILENIDMVELLPQVERRRLEAEMMDLIVSTELDARGTVKLSPVELARVQQEYNDFLAAIQLKELFVLTTDSKATQSDSNQTASAESSPVEIIDLDANNEEFEEKIEAKEIHDFAPAEVKEEETLLQPLSKPSLSIQWPRWIPLAEADQYVRPCVVRLKRTVLEDDLPLAVIKSKVKD